MRKTDKNSIDAMFDNAEYEAIELCIARGKTSEASGINARAKGRDRRILIPMLEALIEGALEMFKRNGIIDNIEQEKLALMLMLQESIQKQTNDKEVM